MRTVLVVMTPAAGMSAAGLIAGWPTIGFLASSRFAVLMASHPFVRRTHDAQLCRVSCKGSCTVSHSRDHGEHVCHGCSTLSKRPCTAHLRAAAVPTTSSRTSGSSTTQASKSRPTGPRRRPRLRSHRSPAPPLKPPPSPPRRPRGCTITSSPPTSAQLRLRRRWSSSESGAQPRGTLLPPPGQTASIQWPGQ